MADSAIQIPPLKEIAEELGPPGAEAQAALNPPGSQDVFRVIGAQIA